jgi:hypothetical protein
MFIIIEILFIAAMAACVIWAIHDIKKWKIKQ